MSLHSGTRTHYPDFVIVRVFALNAVDREFEPRSCQDSLNLYATLRRKSNDWVVRNQDNVSEYRSGATYVRMVSSEQRIEM
jgi:hypothetical protein